jgi:hypothetical protein
MERALFAEEKLGLVDFRYKKTPVKVLICGH